MQQSHVPMPYDHIVFSEQAETWLIERGIPRREAHQVLTGGETIEERPDTGRGESYLVMGWGEHDTVWGWSEDIPIHVIATDKDEAELTVVVIYRPGRERWSDDFRRRK